MAGELFNFKCIKRNAMAEVTLTIDDNFIKSLQKDTGISKPSQLTNEALVLLRWAVSEMKQGRVLISTDSQGGNPKRVVMSALNQVKSAG